MVAAGGTVDEMAEQKRNREQSLGRAVGIVHRYGMIYMDNELAPLGLGRGTYLFMATLYHNDGMHQEELTRELGINKGTTTRAVSKLEKLGYVRREADPSDRRACRVMLTDKARQIRPAFFDVLIGGTETLARGFTPAERGVALDLLKRMGANMREYVDRVHSEGHSE